MAYRVVKKVNGKSYAYLQRSFREGGSVRTVSEYIGPVDPADAPKPRKRGKNSPAPGAHPPSGTSAPGGWEGLKLRDRERREDVRIVAHERIRLPSNLSKHGISERTARANHAAMIRTLGKLGIPSDRVPFIAVRRGLKTAVKPDPRGGWVVTVPALGRAPRREFRAAYRLALGRVVLEALRTEKPEVFARISLVMDRTFRDTNAALLDYAKAGGHPDAWTWAFCLRLWGYANPLPGRKAEEVGLVGYGARKTWDDAAAGIVGKAFAEGWRAVEWETVREGRNATEAEKRALSRLKNAKGIMGRIRRPELRRRLRAATARRAATREAEIGLFSLRYFLNGGADG